MKIAVIGTGISGLAAAWGLRDAADVVVYERENRLGGHSATVDVDYDGTSIAVDTGFIVYNSLNYPNLTALFDHLGIETEQSNMSFGVSMRGGRSEWSGDSLRSIFAQKRHLISPSFLWMLREIIRFNETSHVDRKAGVLEGMSLGAYLRKRRFSIRFADQYLVPMGAAIWSTPKMDVLSFPAESFVRFFENHRLINWSRPEWRTVSGGSRRYVEKFAADLSGRIRLGHEVVRVSRQCGRIQLTDQHGDTDSFDHVVIASHSDQALAMLALPTDKERQLLGAIKYRPNRVYLHRDTSLMPRRRVIWSSWNYMEGQSPESGRDVGVSYWMNRLQNIDPSKPLFVTLNPPEAPRDDLTFGEYSYAHPQFDRGALDAQKALGAIQGENNTWYCGAYHGYGFHEDGLVSGINVAERLGGRYPWRQSETYEDRYQVAAE